MTTDRPSIEERLRGAGLPTLPRLAWLEIDLSALTGNTRVIRAMLPEGHDLAAVVKADGYGHGVVAASQAVLKGGATVLAVATLDEALALRAAGYARRLLVLFVIPPDGVDEALAAGIEPVAMDQESVEALAAGVRRRSGATAGPVAGAGVHLGIDTGMTRGGILPSRVGEAARVLLYAGIDRLAGTWSHLASPEDPDAASRQVAAFELGLRELAAAGIDPGQRHLNATGGLLGDITPRYDLTRIGIGLYGHLHPDVHIAPERAAGAAALRPALRLKARPVSIQDIPAATSVGYGGTWRADRRSRIAILPLGYADGWARGPASIATVRSDGLDLPVVGRVSMDAIAIDVTDAPGFSHATEVVVVAPEGEGGTSVEALAGRRETISWEVLTGFSPRLSRVYLEDSRIVGLRRLDGGLVAAGGFAFDL